MAQNGSQKNTELGEDKMTHNLTQAEDMTTKEQLEAALDFSTRNRLYDKQGYPLPELTIIHDAARERLESLKGGFTRAAILDPYRNHCTAQEEQLSGRVWIYTDEALIALCRSIESHRPIVQSPEVEAAVADFDILIACMTDEQRYLQQPHIQNVTAVLQSFRPLPVGDIPYLAEAIATYRHKDGIPASEDLGTFQIESRLFWALLNAAERYLTTTPLPVSEIPADHEAVIQKAMADNDWPRDRVLTQAIRVYQLMLAGHLVNKLSGLASLDAPNAQPLPAFEKVRGTLAFYADPKNYERNHELETGPNVRYDAGQKARKALALLSTVEQPTPEGYTPIRTLYLAQIKSDLNVLRRQCEESAAALRNLDRTWSAKSSEFIAQSFDRKKTYCATILKELEAELSPQACEVQSPSNTTQNNQQSADTTQALTQDSGWLPIEDYNRQEREYATFWCKFEKTIWLPLTGYLRYSGGDKAHPFFVTPAHAEYGVRTHVTHWMPLPPAPAAQDKAGG